MCPRCNALWWSPVYVWRISEKTRRTSLAATEVWSRARERSAIKLLVTRRIAIQTYCFSRARCASSGASLLAAQSRERSPAAKQSGAR